MPRFLVKLAIFSLLFPVVYIAAYSAVRAAYIRSLDLPENALYVWGDSQGYLGLDLQRLSELTERPVLSFATHGSGMNDLYVFADSVPADSDVLICAGLPMLIRETDRDFHRSGLSLRGILGMVRGPYSWKNLWYVFRMNRDPLNVVVRQESPAAYPVTETPSLKRREAYAIDDESMELPAFYLQRIPLFRGGIDVLESKGCHVTIVPFPLSAANSQRRWEKLYEEFRPLEGEHVILADHPRLSTDRNLMYDISHFNSDGREEMTEYVGKVLALQREE